MAKKRLVLTFPPEVVERPVVALMVRDFDIITNILRAEIHEGEIGRMLVELEGNARKLKEGVAYLKDLGVQVEEAITDIELDEALCIECGACTAVCQPGALKIEPPDWGLTLDKDRCILCGFCVDACPLDIISVKF
ncbi:MAG: 4Fe-4S binding protein [Actinobacteria bacterium]|nr:4Fe-4S binding protein [Actinomycetota bacterium]MBU1942651.1 4Fe-4S binding protein [Actinomycetota bacterium]MBU2685973.1 4Fe-4S binding protein [Actinomycetota bacterium]